MPRKDATARTIMDSTRTRATKMSDWRRNRHAVAVSNRTLPHYTNQERLIAATVRTHLEIHILGPIRALCSGVKSIIRMRGADGVAQNEGPFGLINISDVGNNVAQVSLTSSFFKKNEHTASLYLENSSLAPTHHVHPLSPTSLPRSKNSFTLTSIPLIANILGISRKMYGCNSLKVDMTTKVFYILPRRERQIFSHVTHRSTRSQTRGCHRNVGWTYRGK